MKDKINEEEDIEEVKDNEKCCPWINWKNIFLSLFLVVIAVVFIAFVIIEKNFPGITDIGKGFVFSSQDSVSRNLGKINLIVLGKSGQGYDSPNLTDTMILASISLKAPQIALISLPRDIWIPELRAKLNSVYYWGEKEKDGGGIPLVAQYVQKISGQSINYSVIVDFSGFEKIIDVLGGIEVNVERAFIDEKYPIAGKENADCGKDDKEFKCRYETVEFKEGKTMMNGVTALKFVRSRNAQGDEGTDFAREARQQKVISAIKQKLLDKNTLLSPRKLALIWQTVRQYIKTDIDNYTLGLLGKYALKAQGNIKSYIIPEDLLVNPPKEKRYDFLYVFIPESGDWNEVHAWVSELIKN